MGKQITFTFFFYNCFKQEVDVGYKFALQIILRLHAGVSSYSSQVVAAPKLQVVAASKSSQRNKKFSSHLKGNAITLAHERG